ncbi:MAG: methyltransferase domain-containing protein [Nitrospirota bacterium]|nr:MAG: methyltransferase domain-containing protein [Nitrospirota bacterium]
MMKDSMYSSGVYLSNNPSWHEEDSSWKAIQVLKLIEKHGLKIRSICEVGCGSGEILNQLYERMGDGIIFTGYEISPQAYEISKKKEKERLKYHLADISSEKDNICDLLLCMDVVEHVEDYLGFLRILKKKAAYKVFHIPLDIHVGAVLTRHFIKIRERAGHIHYFTKETALATLAGAGYEIIDSYYSDTELELAGRNMRQRLLGIPRRLADFISTDLSVRLFGGRSLLILSR